MLLLLDKGPPGPFKCPQHKICIENIFVGGIEFEKDTSLGSIPSEKFLESGTWVRTELVKGMLGVSFELPLQHLKDVAVRFRWVCVSVGVEVALLANFWCERRLGRGVQSGYCECHCDG